MSDVIAAIATARGEGAIGIVRISGEGALFVAQQVFSPRERLNKENARKLMYGHVVDSKGQVVDEVLAVYMPAPHSYTGEDVVEIQCHGGSASLEEILKCLYSAGARSAEGGEFTLRAFLNGRIDLTQAEAVMDIITSRTKESLLTAQRIRQGALAQKVRAYRVKLRDIIVQLEAEIDYPEEDIEEISRERVCNTLAQVKAEVEALLATAYYGKVQREGLPVALVGRPNVGKSSILNRLLQEERAIVSPYAGTTRDVVVENLTIGGKLFTLSDTAGIRESYDELEQMGVARSRDVLKNSQLVLFILDSSTKLTLDDMALYEEIKAAEKDYCLVLNKADLPPAFTLATLPLALQSAPHFALSAKEGVGFTDLTKYLVEYSSISSSMDGAVLVTNARHAQLLKAALKSITEALQATKDLLPYDCIIIDAREALASLGKIIGENVSEEILREIFARFCVGK